MHIMAVKFMRMQDSEWEDGIIINNGDGPLIDARGITVPSVWTWTPMTSIFSLTLPFEIKEIK